MKMQLTQFYKNFKHLFSIKHEARQVMKHLCSFS